MATALEVAEAALAKAAGDPAHPRMVIVPVAASEFFPKFADEDGKEPATQDERDEVWAEYLAKFEEAVDELAAEWGDPYYFGPSEDTPNPWGPLGREEACWGHGEFVVCLYYGQEDAELPVAVDLAVVRRDAWDEN